MFEAIINLRDFDNTDQFDKNPIEKRAVSKKDMSRLDTGTVDDTLHRILED